MPDPGASSLAALADSAIVLGFDFGAKRLGVAVGNALTGAARPLSTLDSSTNDARWKGISRVIADWEPALLVVGIPRHPDGAEHEMTLRCERFARQLEGRYGLPVERVDERYSSAVVAEAEDIDAAAAAVILQQWFDQRT